MFSSINRPQSSCAAGGHLRGSVIRDQADCARRLGKEGGGMARIVTFIWSWRRISTETEQPTWATLAEHAHHRSHLFRRLLGRRECNSRLFASQHLKQMLAELVDSLANGRKRPWLGSIGNQQPTQPALQLASRASCESSHLFWRTERPRDLALNLGVGRIRNRNTDNYVGP
jgi:hypothetical protein